MWLVFAALQRGRGNQAVEPILLFGGQSLSIGGGWSPVVTYSSLDGYYSARGARRGKKIEDTLALGRLLDEYNDIVVFRGQDLKAPDCLTHLSQLFDGNLLLIGRNPEKVGNVGRQENVMPLFQGSTYGQSQALLSLRRGSLLSVDQRERDDPQH
jgi:hypothetical protein